MVLAIKVLGSGVLNFGPCAARGHPELSPVGRDGPPRAGCYRAYYNELYSWGTKSCWIQSVGVASKAVNAQHPLPASTTCGWIRATGMCVARPSRLDVNKPARSFGEQNIVGIVGSSLDERYASVVLPVAHRLLKQRLVSSYIHTMHTHASRVYTTSLSTTYERTHSSTLSVAGIRMMTRNSDVALRPLDCVCRWNLEM